MSLPTNFKFKVNHGDQGEVVYKACFINDRLTYSVDWTYNGYPFNTEVPKGKVSELIKSKEWVMINDENDFVNAPPHYSLFPEHSIEVKDVVKLWLDRWETEAETEISFYQAACLKEMLCYILRSPLKNEVEDLEKAQWYLNEIIKEAKNAPSK